MIVKLYLRQGKNGGFATRLSPMGRVTLFNGIDEMQVTEGLYGQYASEDRAMNEAERWAKFLNCGVELYREPDESLNAMPLYRTSRAEDRFKQKARMVGDDSQD